MPKISRPISLRLRGLEDDLQQATKKTGHKAAFIIRAAISQFLKRYKTADEICDALIEARRKGIR